MQNSRSGTDPQFSPAVLARLAQNAMDNPDNGVIVRMAQTFAPHLLTGTLPQQAFVAAAMGEIVTPPPAIDLRPAIMAEVDPPAQPDSLAEITALRSSLWDAGFRPVAVLSHDAEGQLHDGTIGVLPSAGKAPVAGDWTGEARQVPPLDATRPASSRTRNTGLLCDRLRAIDLDVDDEDHARALHALAATMLGHAPMRWRHNSPRVLLLYRAAEGSPGKVIREGKDHSKEQSCRIEVLGHGQQFVAFGTHKSGADLEWWDDAAPGQFKRDDLTAVTEDQIAEFLTAAEGIIGRKVSSPPMPVAAPKASTATPDEFPPATLDQVRECLALIPASTGYDDWLRVGAAVADVDPGHDGFSLWDEWSRGAQNYDAAASRAKWPECCKMDRVHFGTLVTMAKHASGDPTWTPSRTVTGIVSGSSGLEAVPKAKPLKKGITILSAEEAAALPPPSWLIPDVLQRGTLATIFGPPASLKSFLGLHIANTVAYGLEWRGKAIPQERVAYIAAEGASAVGALRNEAWRIHYRQDVRNSKLDLIPHAIALNDPAQVEALISALQGRHAGDSYGLVVVDTMARCTAGADEQSAQAMGLVIDACAQIKDALGGATVLLIHHSGKDAAKGQRGSSALKGNIDAEAMVTRDDRDVALKVWKQKDGEDGHTLHFTTRLQRVREGEDGDLSSLVIVDADGQTEETTTNKDKALRKRIADAIMPGSACDTATLRRAMGAGKNGRFGPEVRAVLPHDEHSAATVIRTDGRMVRMWWDMADGASKAMLHADLVEEDE